MPAYAKSPEQWLANKINEAQNTGRAATKQSTEYVVNPATEVCEAIVGALGYDNKGIATGLKSGTAEVYGIAVFMGGEWHRIEVAGAWHEITALEAKWGQVGGEVPFVRREGGSIRLRGRIGCTSEVTAGETILTLPAGFRPVQGGLLDYKGYPPVRNSELFLVLNGGGVGSLMAETNIATSSQIFLYAYPNFPLT